MVTPLKFKPLNKFIISSDIFTSKEPVGSSATRIHGLLTIALAIDARCFFEDQTEIFRGSCSSSRTSPFQYFSLEIEVNLIQSTFYSYVSTKYSPFFVESLAVLTDIHSSLPKYLL